MSATSANVCQMIVCITNFILIFYVIFFLNGFLKYLNDKNKIKKYEIDMNLDIKQEDVEKELDQFILCRWQEYKVLNLDWKKDIIINSETEKNIMIELGTLVNSSISEVLLSRLSIFYDIRKNKDGISPLDEIIAKKIHMIILSYSLEKK